MLNLKEINDNNIIPIMVSETNPIFIKGFDESEDKKNATVYISDIPVTIYNRIIIKLKDEKDKTKLLEELSEFDLKDEQEVAGMLVYEVSTAIIATKIINELNDLDYVEFATVEKSIIGEPAQLHGIRNIPTELAETNTSTLGTSYTNWSMRPEYLNMQDVWKYVKGDGIIIGISDEGVQSTHPDLTKNYLTGWEITNSILTQNGGKPLNSTKSHGTNVAGMAAASEGSGEAIGTAPNAFIKSFNFFTTTTDLHVAQHYDKLRLDGCEVINCSWGSLTYYMPNKENYTPMAVVSTALQNLEDNNVILVRVSGNSGGVGYLKKDAYTQQWGPFNQSKHSIVENFYEPYSIVVGSVTDKDSTGLNMITRSDFSTMGEYVDICAYGGNYIDPTIGNTYATHITGDEISIQMKAMLLDGSTVFGVSSTDFTSTGGYQPGDFSETTLSGTSFAAPQIAGIVAILKATNPSLTNNEIRDCLFSTADKITNKYWVPAGYISSPCPKELLSSNGLPYKQYTTIGAYRTATGYSLPSLPDSAPIYVFSSTDSNMIPTMFRIDLYYADTDPNKNLTNRKFAMGYSSMPNGDYVYFGIDVYGLINPNYSTNGNDDAYGQGVVNPVNAVKKALSKDFKITLNNNENNYYLIANPGYSASEFKTIIESNTDIVKMFKQDINGNTIQTVDGVGAGDGIFIKTTKPTTITFPGKNVSSIGDMIIDKRDDVEVNKWHLLGASTNIRVDGQTNQTYYVFRNNVWYSYPQVTSVGKVKTRPLHIIYKGEGYWYKKDINNPTN